MFQEKHSSFYFFLFTKVGGKNKPNQAVDGCGCDFEERLFIYLD